MSVWVCSDFHGYKSIYDQICKYIDKDDEVVFLGDAIDRGPHGYELMKAIVNNPQFVYIRGNHEEMFADAIRDIYDGQYYSNRIDLHIYNGGYKTQRDWEQAGGYVSWANKIYGFPTYKKYVNPARNKIYHLSHAGFNPRKDKEIPDSKFLTWDRNHIKTEIWTGEPNEFIIHGHTPIQNFGDNIPIEPYEYCEGHKICIDAGTAYSKKGILYNLDTREYKVFEATEEDMEDNYFG